MMAWSCDPNPALEIGIGIGLFQSWFVDMDASSDFASPGGLLLGFASSCESMVDCFALDLSHLLPVRTLEAIGPAAR